MNNNQNDNCNYRRALEKIEHDQKFKPTCCAVVGPTGPTGVYDYLFSKINRDYYSTKNIHHIKL